MINERSVTYSGEISRVALDGVPLRDYFAGIAFRLLLQVHIDNSIDDLSKPVIAHEAYSYADAMIRERVPMITTAHTDKAAL